MSYSQVAHEAIDDCEDKRLPLVLLTLNEKGNLNVITNVPMTPESVGRINKVLVNAQQILAQRFGN